MRAIPVRRPDRRQCGFTLIEALIVIVITGILAGVATLFIRAPVQNYADSAARAELSDIADTALRRIARDLRVALPNSIRVSADGLSLEFVPTKAGGRYLAAEDEIGGNVLSFTDPTKLSFAVLGPMPPAPYGIVAGDGIVVYNLGQGYAPADVYSGGNLALVAGVNGNLVTLAANPFAQQVPAMASPGRRFQVVGAPVTYTCNLTNGTLTRISNYPLSPTQNAPPVGAAQTQALLAGDVASCAFEYAALANTHSGLLGLRIVLQRPGSADGPVTLSHQIHVDNVP